MRRGRCQSHSHRGGQNGGEHVNSHIGGKQNGFSIAPDRAACIPKQRRQNLSSSVWTDLFGMITPLLSARVSVGWELIRMTDLSRLNPL